MSLPLFVVQSPQQINIVAIAPICVSYASKQRTSDSLSRIININFLLFQFIRNKYCQSVFLVLYLLQHLIVGTSNLSQYPRTDWMQRG